MAPATAMNRRLIRRLALALIAMLAFAQASIALAACSVDRGEMAQMVATGDDCCGTAELQAWEAQLTNDCVAHCTADLQLSRLPIALVHRASDSAVLLLPHRERGSPPTGQVEPLAARVIPPRILLHSFLI
jgi:hypothetical protein